MSFAIGSRNISEDTPAFIIAEMSCNHRGSLDVALKSVRAMKASGADAVKLQTYTPDTITIDSDREFFRIEHGTLWDGRTLHDLYREAYTPWEWHEKIQQAAHDEGLIFFSSPFDPSAADFLDRMKVPAFKIASFEITDIPLIRYVAEKGKPMILSTGIAQLADIELALNACRAAGNNQLALLKCTSVYPAPLENLDLRTIANMSGTFGVVAGVSDHTRGTLVPALSVALGARIVEKHFILDRALGGPDAEFSLDPREFAEMVASVRDAEKAMGTVNYNLSAQALRNRQFSRSLFAVSDVKAGDVFSAENVRSIRPGHGLEPRHLGLVLGHAAAQDIARGTPLTWNHIGAKK